MHSDVNNFLDLCTCVVLDGSAGKHYVLSKEGIIVMNLRYKTRSYKKYGECNFFCLHGSWNRKRLYHSQKFVHYSYEP